MDHRTADVPSSFINMSDVNLILDSARCREVGSNAIDSEREERAKAGRSDSVRVKLLLRIN